METEQESYLLDRGILKEAALMLMPRKKPLGTQGALSLCLGMCAMCVCVYMMNVPVHMAMCEGGHAHAT